MFWKEKQFKFSIRKFNVGVASAVIGMAGLATVLPSETVKADTTAKPTCTVGDHISYKYVVYSDLTDAEKSQIQSSLPTDSAGDYETYYMVYRPTSEFLPNTGVRTGAVATLTGSGLLIVGLALSKNKKKRIISSLVFLAATGAVSVSAISTGSLSGFDKTYTLKVGDTIPETVLAIDNYDFVGYILVEDTTPECFVEGNASTTSTELFQTESAQNILETESTSVSPVSESVPASLTVSSQVAETSYASSELSPVRVEQVTTTTQPTIVPEAPQAPAVSSSYIEPTTSVSYDSSISITSSESLSVVHSESEVISMVEIISEIEVPMTSMVADSDGSTSEVVSMSVSQVVSQSEVVSLVSVTSEVVVPITSEVVVEVSEVITEQPVISEVSIVETSEGSISEATSVALEVYSEVATETEPSALKEDIITTESKVITRTVNFVDSDGKSIMTSAVQPVTVTRTKIVNGETGEVTYGEWTTTSFAPLTVPTLSNYTGSVESIPAMNVSGDSTDTDLTVTYSPIMTSGTETKEVTRQVVFVNESGDNLAPDIIQRAIYSRQIETNEVTKEVTYSDWTAEVSGFDQLTVPAFLNYTPDVTFVPAASSNPNVATTNFKVTYKADMAQEPEERRITRTLSFVDETGKELIPPVVQEVIYKRSNTRNKVTNELTEGTWVTDKSSFDAYTSPVLKGYTADQTEIPTETTTAESLNSQITIIYKENILTGTESKSITRTVTYVMEDGSPAADDAVQTVVFTRTTSTNEVTGVTEYSNWTSDAPEFASQDSPEVTNYTADTQQVAAMEVTADSSDQNVIVTYKANITEGIDERVVTRLVHYIYEDDQSEASPTVTQTVTYTRPKFTNEVTKEVTYGEWGIATQDISALVSPLIDGYMADRAVVDYLPTTPDSFDTEETVRYTNKVIEIKDVDVAALYTSDTSLGYSKVMSLESAPANLSSYYVKVNSDRFKEMQLPVRSIETATVNGKEFFKVTASHPLLKQDENNDGVREYADNYVFYVAKQDASLTGIKTFKELLAAIEADPSGEYILANDLSAADVDLSATDEAYITTLFTGKINGQNKDKSFAIYDLKAPLFSHLSGATVSNLDLKNVAINQHTSRVASLAQVASNGTVIENVAVQGNIESSYIIGTYDSTTSDERTSIVGGVVAVLNGSTITNSSFKGTIDADSSSVRIIHNGYLYKSLLMLGGLVGQSTGASTVTNNRVSADIAINAIQNTAITNGNIQTTLLAGGLLGSHSSGSVVNNTTGNYTEGTINNMVEHNAIYSDGQDRSNYIGNVGGLFGETGTNGRIGNNLTAMKVTNGNLVHGTPGNRNAWGMANMYLDGVATGTVDTWARMGAQSHAETIKSLNTSTLDDSDQFITNAYDADYTVISGYQSSHKQAYENLEKFLPFYNKEYLVSQANTLAVTDNLVIKEVLSVTPMIGNTVVSDVSGQSEMINRILINYADGTVEYKDVTYKGLFLDTQIAEYKVSGTELIFTTDQFNGSYEPLIAAVIPSLSAVTLNGPEIAAALRDTTVTSQELETLSLDKTFAEIQANLDQVLKNVLGTSTVYGDTQAVVKKIEDHKAELLLGLSYISRWYNIDFEDINIQNIATFHQDFFGKPVETLDWLIDVGSSGYRALNPVNNDIKNSTFMGKNAGTETLPGYLELFRQRFAGNMTAAAWFYSSAKAYIVEAQSVGANGQPIGDEKLYNKLQTAYIDTSNQTGLTVDYSNMILPLLTMSEDKVYIISTMEGVQFGMIDSYVDASLETTNPELYAANLAAFKAIVDQEGKNQGAFWSAWYRIANDAVKDKLQNVLPTWDTFKLYDGSWASRYGETAPTAVSEFFNPVGKYKSKPNNSEAYSDGVNVVYVAMKALDQDGHKGGSVWTHEKTHVWDGRVFLGGNGRRPGHGMESFAEGVLQSPRNDGGRLSNKMTFNLYADWTGTDQFPEYNKSPERFQNQEDLQEYTQGMMDVVYTLDLATYEAVKDLSTSDKQLIFVKHFGIADGNNQYDNIRKFTAAELESMMTLEDYIKNGVMISIDGYGYRRLSGTQELKAMSIDGKYNGYWSNNLFISDYGLQGSSTGTVGDPSFKRVAYEMMAYAGYNDGFLAYISNQLAEAAKADGKPLTDTYILETVSQGTYADYETFKAAMFNERSAKLTGLQPLGEITVTSGRNTTRTVTINSYEDLTKALTEFVALDINEIKTGNTNYNWSNWATNLKREVYIAYLDQTDEFNRSVFA